MTEFPLLESSPALTGAFSHAIEAFGEGEGGVGTGGGFLPHGQRGVDIASVAGVVHRAEDEFEWWFLAMLVDQTITRRAKE